MIISYPEGEDKSNGLSEAAKRKLAATPDSTSERPS
jgi:hypothetical protein